MLSVEHGVVRFLMTAFRRQSLIAHEPRWACHHQQHPKPLAIELGQIWPLSSPSNQDREHISPLFRRSILAIEADRRARFAHASS